MLLHLRIHHFKQVSPLIHLFTYLKHRSIFIHTSSQLSPSSSLNFSGIAKSVLISSSYCDRNGETFVKPSLSHLLLNLCKINPKIARRFFRVSELKSQDVLEILLGVNSDNEDKGIEHIWGIFKWASEQIGDFKHLPQSCKLMSFLLVRSGMYMEAEFVLSTIENRETLLQSEEIFSSLIEGYLHEGNFDRVNWNFSRMRELGLVPSLSCYNNLLKYMIQISEADLALQVCLDMAENGLLKCTKNVDNVIHLLCRARRNTEARNLVKKVINIGVEPSLLALNAVASEYCEKKDYDDALSLFAAINHAPNALISNKIIHSVCNDSGIESAIEYIHELEDIGFSPNEITFSILIGWSCRERKLKSAFTLLLENSSRSLKPNICSYNAIMSGVFLEGTWIHGQEIFREMIDIGLVPDRTTFRVLLAGYCKGRRFDEVKITVKDMVDRNLIQLNEHEDLLTRGFRFLGLDPSNVKIRRDNEKLFSKTEFYDNLGNGLYLDTDVDKFEKTLTGVLLDSMVPDYNTMVLKSCGEKDFKTALVLLDEMLQWGQELSFTAFTAVVKGIYQSGHHITIITNLIEKLPKFAYQIDQEILNSVVRTHCKNGSTNKATTIIDKMVQRNLQIEYRTYTDLIISLCKDRDMGRFRNYWDVARVNKWIPELNDCETLIGLLCNQQMLDKMLELLESMMSAYSNLVLCACNIWLEKLCETGFTRTGCVLVDKLMKNGLVFDSVSYSHLIRGFFKEKKIPEALTLCDVMLSKNLVPEYDVSVSLIPHLCKAGCYAKAISLKEKSLRIQPSVSVEGHCDFISSFCKSGMVKEAADVVREMLLMGLTPNFEIYNFLVQAFCLSKNSVKISELLGIMIRKNISFSISSYQKLASFMCMEGKLVLATSLKELMMKENNLPDIVIYNILIFYLFLSRNEVHVDTVLTELQGKGIEPDSTTYNFLVHGFSQCKLLSRAIHYYTAMVSKKLGPNNRSLREVICCLCENGDVVNALKLSGEMESRNLVHSSIVQNKITDLMLTNGKIQEAVGFLDRMEEKGLIPNNISYDQTIKSFCLIGKQEKAIDLLDIMLKKGSIPSFISYNRIIQSLCKSNKTEQALDFYSEMMYRNLYPSIETWNILTHNLCEEGKTTEAERVLDSMVQIGETPSREMYKSLCNRYRSENNSSKASQILKQMQKYGYEPDFETHWSLIKNLSISSDKGNSKNNSSFLSKLLSGSGFS